MDTKDGKMHHYCTTELQNIPLHEPHYALLPPYSITQATPPRRKTVQITPQYRRNRCSRT
ncbi:hypothetical protein [Segatella oulorum]|uniref:hypothetical protein n=1 Tax=Segatella oulorum TaxID=28136 RepID=UPI0028E911E9|nr:hypothetical protein [Segatella oulorum]